MLIETLLWIAAVLLVLAGMAGLVFPVLPGALLIFGGLFIAAWVEGFRHIGSGTLTVLGIMAALMYIVDFIASAFGAKRFGASSRAIIGATVGAIVGLFFGIVGVLLGPFIGAVIGEFSSRPDLRAAGRAGVGATLGLALGAAAKLALAFTMLGIFIVMRFI